MKTRTLSLLIAFCIILSLFPVSAAEAPKITIITQPAPLTVVTQGEISGKLYVNAIASAGSELSYQWYESTFYDTNKYGVEIPGATSAEFKIPVNITVSKDYFCEVRARGAEPVRTNVANVVVQTPAPVITITKQPEKITTVYQKYKTINAELTVEATATNYGFVKYQWYSNTKNSNVGGTPVSSASSLGTFKLPYDLKVGTYYYFCEVTSTRAEPVRSEVATVVVEPERAEIIIHSQPEKTISLIMGNIDVRTLNVIARASSNAELSYQWYSNAVCDNNSGTPIAGATKSSFKIPSDLKGGTYYYYCKLSAPGAEPVCTDATTVTVKVKESRNAPPAPTLESKTADSITVVYNNIDLEFSMDGKNWGGPIFKGLTPYTTYTIYARYKETNTHYMSPISEPLIVRTPKWYKDKDNQEAPSTPQLLSKTGRSVTLKPIKGAEYSRDGYTWQDSNTFYNLSFSTTYKFWARMKETDELKESPMSSPVTVTTEASGGFPFVPSDKNMTNGIVKSGWAYIMNRDYSYLAWDGSGFVGPSRDVALFYFEHLGNNKYYIRTANGGYLSYLGKPRNMAQVIISDKPCEWKIYSYAESGYVEYNICVASDTTCYIKFWHYCWEYIDTHVTLEKDDSTRFKREGADLTISTLFVEARLPQWWKDYKAGKTEPTYKVVETTVFEASMSDKPTDSIGNVTKKTSIPKELSHTTQEEWDAIQLTNIARAQEGLPLLVTFSKMQEMAGARSDELSKDFKDGHTRLDGTAYSTIFDQYGFSTTVRSENSHQATSSFSSPTYALDSWLYSDGHRKNIKTESFTYIGIGYTYRNSLGNWEQLFASSKDSECVSIEYDAEKGYFTLKLKNGITTYAPYDEKSSPMKDGKVTFNYPGVNRAKSSTVNTSATNETGQGSSGETSSGETPSGRITEPSVPVTAPVTANPSDTRFVMNGKAVSVTAAYNINGTNYLQIRAIAAMLNGTAAQFDVDWDGQYAIIEPGKPYSGTVTETRLQSTTDVRNSDTKFKMNGEVFTFSDARLIDGDTNYIQLHEFAQKLSGTPSQFNVYWDNEARQAVIQPGVYYTGEAPVDNPSDDINSKEKEIYYIKASKNENFVIDVSGASEEDGAKLNLRAWNGNDNQKFRLIKMDGDVYVIQCVHSGKWWTSSGKKGAVLTQSVSVTDGSAITFRVIKQANGTYRIMDSTGLYVGISEAKMENGSNIILWTEAYDESQTFILEKID